MNGRFHFTRRSARTWAAAGAITALMGGATWHGLAANPATATPAAAVTTPIAHAIAGARDSYADVVNVVAPAVVTVRVTGHARMSPTQFEMPDMPDDFFNQFFGQRGQRGQRAPMTPREMPRQRQSALGSGVVVT